MIGDSVFSADSKIVHPPPNLLPILTILVLTGQERPVSRRPIDDLIWSENTPDQINADFRQTLVRIMRFQDEHEIQLLAANTSTLAFGIKIPALIKA